MGTGASSEPNNVKVQNGIGIQKKPIPLYKFAGGGMNEQMEKKAGLEAIFGRKEAGKRNYYLINPGQPLFERTGDNCLGILCCLIPPMK